MKVYQVLPPRVLITVKSDNTVGNTEQGTEERSHITTLTWVQFQEFVFLRTASVWLSASELIKVNAVLDHATSDKVSGSLSRSVCDIRESDSENLETFASVPVSLFFNPGGL